MSMNELEANWNHTLHKYISIVHILEQITCIILNWGPSLCLLRKASNPSRLQRIENSYERDYCLWNATLIGTTISTFRKIVWDLENGFKEWCFNKSLSMRWLTNLPQCEFDLYAFLAFILFNILKYRHPRGNMFNALNGTKE